MAPSTPSKMTYRFLGNSGLLVSELSLGTWMDYDEKHTVDGWYSIMELAFKHGVNFFDTAEIYGWGQAEGLLGGAIKKGIAQKTWSREDLVISTKIFPGTKGFEEGGPNDQGNGRKHIVEGLKASLRRLDLEYVDVVFSHRPEVYTPIEETVRAMNFVINQGWAFYWGTSEWPPSQIREACEIADRLGLIRPIVEQAQYNIFERNKVEFDYVDLYKKYKLGLTTWSPLAYGTLTGKYSAGKPEGSRFTTSLFGDDSPFSEGFQERVEAADKLKPIAKELGCSMAQMAIAWAVTNKNVSTVLLGASRPSQLEENLKSLEVVSKITPEVKAKINTIVNFVPKVSEMDQFATLLMAPNSTDTTSTKMSYRFLGNSGLLVSKFSLGSWMWASDEYTVDAWYKMMATAFNGGVNLFDTAENYGETLAERNMGGAIKRGIKEGIWTREDLVVTAKLFAGTIAWDQSSPNAQGLCRKHIIEGLKASLKRMQLDYVDVVFCHRPDALTPIEETVRAMNFVIEQGWAFYWGTSEWLASDITEACEIADRLGLIRPIVEQPQYNILERNKVEFEFLDLYKKYKLGLTVWSPLASGYLTGKYSAPTPGASRLTKKLEAGPPLPSELCVESVEKADKLKPIAKELGCTLAQLALAWCVSNENVSTVLLGASRPSQLEENLKSLEIVSKITPEVKAKINAIVNFVPKVPEMDQIAMLRGRHL
ncbi:hypothetical protein BBO99_00002228 [Phytophthora kernoviae]|uniref:NADP-dependent oxidoreductase domain-containing protein n=1 Tax=Phytophthora kernoviae TaxID=325452 RepID=A0A3R7HLT5_9STRA|nr:hypothetical protein BBO99_00002228 [Phytophthora kernoviae]